MNDPLGGIVATLETLKHEASCRNKRAEHYQYKMKKNIPEYPVGVLFQDLPSFPRNEKSPIQTSFPAGQFS